MGFGFAFLPLYVCEDLKLIEKQAKAAHLDLQAKFQRFADSGELRAAIASGLIDMGPFGTAPLLAAWQQTKEKPRQILAVSGISSVPLVLLSNRADERSIADLKSADRIAVPTLTSPQMYLLEMQSEKTFGKFDHLRDQIITLSHAQAIAALAENTGQATAYFSSPPFTQIALRAANVHVMAKLNRYHERQVVISDPRCAPFLRRRAAAGGRSRRQSARRSGAPYSRRSETRGANLLDARAVRDAQRRRDGGSHPRCQG